MFRAAAPRGPTLRPLTQSLKQSSRCAQPITQLSTRASISHFTKSESRAKILALTSYCRNTSLVRSYATEAAPGTQHRPELEKQYREKKLEPNPELVSYGSTVHPIQGEVGVEDKEEDTDMLAGIKHDIKVIGDTFNLNAVPKEALRIGLAGVIPYLFTSTATAACAFEMNAAATTGSGIFLSLPTAEALLHILEPLQVGYGAVILSCLGTVHWGLEWAGYGGTGGYKRYAIGVLAPAVAWPTVLMPVEYALITQFLAFNTLYAVDSSTVTKGWTPPWYGTYRFILTFVVGASIVISLVGRGQVQDRVGEAPTAAERMKALQQIGQGDAPGAAIKKHTGESGGE